MFSMRAFRIVGDPGYQTCRKSSLCPRRERVSRRGVAMKTKLLGLLAGIGICALAVQPAAALSFTFVTPTGSTCGGEACAAEADITTSASSISVTLTNLLTPTQIISAGQALSDLSFTLSNAPGTQGTLTASGQLANIGAGGSVTNVGGSPVRFIGQGPLPLAVRVLSPFRVTPS
jgi:hypothetical protein